MTPQFSEVGCGLLALHCPLCGLRNLHQDATSVFDDGTELRFWCEHCSEKTVSLRVFQTKGETLVEWCAVGQSREERDPYLKNLRDALVIAKEAHEITVFLNEDAQQIAKSLLEHLEVEIGQIERCRRSAERAR